MIYSLNDEDCSGPASTQYDVCVIGAGAAGITLTSQLAQSGLNVALMEAGDQHVTAESQMLYDGQVIAEDTTFPYEFPTVMPRSPGASASISVVASDLSGSSGISAT